MPQVLVRCPLNKFELPHQDRLQPPAVSHLRRREALAPAARLLLGKIREGAVLDFQWPDLLEQFGARRRRESTAGPSGVDQFVTFVIADDQCVEVLKTMAYIQRYVPARGRKCEWTGVRNSLWRANRTINWSGSGGSSQTGCGDYLASAYTIASSNAKTSAIPPSIRKALPRLALVIGPPGYSPASSGA